MLIQALTTACALMGLRMRSPVMIAPSIQSELDTLPVFTVANKDEKPLQYEVNGQPMAIFYADVEAAKSALEAATGQNPDLGCDLIPVGLGAAYGLSCDGKATMVPGVTELTAAGMPAGVSPVGQELPLFACMEMKRETEEGDTVLPLFMSFGDCEAAVKEAREAAENPQLEIVPLGLASIIEHLATIEDDKPAFSFIAPTTSTKHISSYVGSGVYARVVEEEEE